MRGRIDHRALVVRQRIDSLMHNVRTIARSPAAPPVAFICGFLLADRGQSVPGGIKRVHGLLTGLMGPAQALQIASAIAPGLVGSDSPSPTR